MDAGGGMRQVEYDVVIVGGGMVGATLALMLAQRPGLRIAIVEAASPPQTDAHGFQPSFDGRSTALSRSTAQAFVQLGLWPEIRRYSQPIRHIEVSEKGRWGRVRLDAEEEGIEALGFVMENAWLGRLLYGACTADAAIDWMSACRVQAIDAVAGVQRVQVHSATGEFLLQARLLVAADGAHSSLRAAMQVASDTFDYTQCAVVCNVDSSEAHADRAYERFCHGEVLALLPRVDASRALIWTAPPARARELERAQEGEFLRQLGQRLGPAWGRWRARTAPVVYPLQRIIARQQVQAGRVLLGNAAHFLHPVAGQGFNLCVRDAAALARTVHAQLERGGDPGDIASLRLYEEGRRRDQALITTFSDRLVRLFAVDHALLSHLRSLGMSLFDLTPGSKTLLARLSMGAL